jgi:hypothetical protein
MHAMNLKKSLGAGGDRTRDAVVACQVAIQYTIQLDTVTMILLQHNSVRNGLRKFMEIADFFPGIGSGFYCTLLY